jgi:hypothetical protein
MSLKNLGNKEQKLVKHIANKAQLIEEGHKVRKEDMAYLIPYWTEHLKRFGEIILDLDNIPKSVEKSRSTERTATVGRKDRIWI